MNSIIWLVIFAVMIVVEIFTLGMTTIWFGVGAVGAAVAAWLGFDLWVQVLVFAILSIAVMAIFRPIAVRFLNKDKEKTNVEGVIGKTAVVIRQIDNEKAEGAVNLNGMEWTARSEDGRVISEEERVTVVSVNGVKLIVK